MIGFKIDKESLVFGFITACFGVGMISFIMELVKVLLHWRIDDIFVLFVFILMILALSIYIPNGRVKNVKRSKRQSKHN